LNHSSDYRLWDASAWWFETSLLEGGRSPIYLWCKWHPEKLPTDVNDANAYLQGWFSGPSRQDEDKYGLQWIEAAYSGREPNVAVFAAYITPGYLITQNDWDFHRYDPDPQRHLNWENKPYFKTYARFTTTGAPAGARMVVKLYTYNNVGADDSVSWSTYLDEPNCLTQYDELSIPILGDDWQWQQFKGALPKPELLGGSKGTTDHNDPNNGNVLFVISVEGGDAALC
jgi:hypothetical protein